MLGLQEYSNTLIILKMLRDLYGFMNISEEFLSRKWQEMQLFENNDPVSLEIGKVKRLDNTKCHCKNTFLKTRRIHLGGNAQIFTLWKGVREELKNKTTTSQ